MNWLSRIPSLFKTAKNKPIKTRPHARLALECLEERVMPYSATGNAWPNPQLITISFMPDGTQLSAAANSTITSNLFSTMNAKFGSPANWENVIVRAAQVWAQQTNLNFEVVPDNGAPSGSGSNQQGDPGFGDIRIGGYAFSNTQLGDTFYPPSANNYSIAGDIAFNTGQTWNIGSTYDLFTVAAHEFGHALGLGDSSASTSAIMYGSYTGVKSVLSSDDIAGIRNIYSGNNPRTPDAYDSGSGDNTVASAANISSLFKSGSLTALVSNLNIVTTSDVAFYAFAAPTGTSSTMQVQVQSQGLSLLSPKMTVYAANGTTVLGSASGLNEYGTILDVSVTGVTAGEKFYIKVQGADTTAFSTGAYALALNFGAGAMPVAPSPIVPYADGSPLSGSGGVADDPKSTIQLLADNTLITGISPDTGASSNDGVTNASRIVFSGTGPALNTIDIFQMGVNGAPNQLIGTTLDVLGTIWSFNYTNHPLANGTYIFYATAGGLLGLLGGGNPSTTYTVVIDTVAPPPPSISSIAPDTAATATNPVTNVSDPILLGTAQANSTVSVYQNGLVVGTTTAASNGNWQYNSQNLPNGNYAFTATATDLAGNVSQFSQPLLVTVATPPAAPVIAGVSQTTAAGNQILTLCGTAGANSTVTVYCSGALLGSITANSNGAWQYAYQRATFANGNYRFTAKTTDQTGVTSAASSFNLVLGGQTLAAPQLTASSILNTSGGSITASATPTFTGTATAGTLVTIVDGATILGTAVANANGQWSFTSPTLVAGNHGVCVFATDSLGDQGLLSDPLDFQI